MSTEGNAYAIALENLHYFEKDIQDAFKRYAGKNQQINIDNTTELVREVSELFSLDCEGSTYFFSKENQKIAGMYDLTALKLEEFLELYKLWLKKESEMFENHSTRFDQNDNIQPSYADGSLDLSKDQNSNRPISNYESSVALLNEIINQNREHFENSFRSKVQEEELEISLQDYLSFLKDCFDFSKVELKDKLNEAEDFFSLPNLSEKLLNITGRYLLEIKEIDPSNIEVQELRFSYYDCFELLNYWLKNDENLALIDKRVKVIQGAQGGVRWALLETIEKYEKMLNEAIEPNEKEVLQTAIDALKTKLQEIDNPKGRSKSVKDGMDPKRKEDKRVKALKEIFDFYCLQQLNIGQNCTFDKYNKLSNTINLGTFKAMLKNFRLKIDHMKLLELFNKSPEIEENFDFNEFTEFLSKVALWVEIVTEVKVHQPKPEIMKNYKPDSYKYDESYKVFKQNEAKKKDISIILKRKHELTLAEQKKRDNDRLEEVWEHMGLYDGMYKTWMGLFRLPFHSRDKENFRIAPGSLQYKFKSKGNETKSSLEVLEEIQRRNELRKLVKDLRTVEKSFISNYRSGSNSTRMNTSRQSKEECNNTYLMQKQTKSKQSLPNIKKLTMKGLETIQDEDIAKIDDKFNPHDLIEENDEEDDFYLADYDISSKKTLRGQEPVDKKKYEQYGRLKKVSKGFAVNGKYGGGSPRTQENIRMPPDGDLSGRMYMNPSYSEYRNYTNTRISPGDKAMLGRYPTKSIKGVTPISRPTYVDHEMISQYNQKQPRNPYLYQNQHAPVPDLHLNNEDYYNSNGSIQSYGSTGQHSTNNGYPMPRTQGYNSTNNRVSQIQIEAQRRQQQMMDNVMNIQDSRLKKGLKVIRK